MGWERPRIREFFESRNLLVQEWDQVRTDWLTFRPADGKTSTLLPQEAVAALAQ